MVQGVLHPNPAGGLAADHSYLGDLPLARGSCLAQGHASFPGRVSTLRMVYVGDAKSRSLVWIWDIAKGHPSLRAPGGVSGGLHYKLSLYPNPPSFLTNIAPQSILHKTSS